MKKQQILVGFVVLFFCISFSGCTENNILTDKEKFLGNWAWTEPAYNSKLDEWLNSTGNMTFFKNGTVKAMSDARENITDYGEYQIRDKILIIHLYMYDNYSTVGHYSFSNNNQKFILTNQSKNMTIIFVKND